MLRPTLLPWLFVFLVATAPPARATISFGEADAHFAAGDYRAALASLDEFLGDGGRQPEARAEALRARSFLQLRMGLEGAFSGLLEALVSDPDHSSTPYLGEMASDAYQLWGHYPGWEEDVARLRELSPEHPGLHPLASYLEGVQADLAADAEGIARADRARGLFPSLLMAGPFGNVGGSGMSRHHPPEDGIDPTAEMVASKGFRFGWVELPARLWGSFDVDIFTDDEPDAVVYGAGHVHVDAAKGAELYLSGALSAKAWVNGGLVLDQPRYHSGEPLYAVPVDLREGWNQVVVKAGAESQRLDFRVGLRGRGGGPLEFDFRAMPPEGYEPVPLAASSPTLPSPVPPPLDRWRELPFGEGAFGRALLLLALSMADREEDLLELSRECTGLYPDHGYFRYMLGIAMRALGEPGHEELFTLAAQQAPEDWRARSLALSVLEDGATEAEVDDAYEALFADLGDRPWGVAKYAGHLVGTDRVPRAIELLAEAFEDFPRHDTIAEDYQAALQKADRDEQRREVLERAHELQPDDPAHPWRLAFLARRAERYDEALRYFDLALIGNGNPRSLHVERAETLVNAGRPAEAIAAWQQALRWAPHEAWLHEQLGQLYLEEGQEEPAIASLERALQIDPTDRQVRESLRRLRGQRSLEELIGQPSIAELREAELDWLDEGQPTVILLDHVQTVVHEGGSSSQERRVVVLVRDAVGVTGYQPLQTSGIADYARIHKPDGRVLEGERGFGEVALPQLEPGDLIEWAESAQFPPPAGFPGHSWNSNDFSLGEPVLLSRYSLILPAGTTLRWELHNGEPDHRVEEFDDLVLHEWDQHRLDGVVFEEMAPPYPEVYCWLDYSTVPDWDHVVEWYLSETHGRLQPTPRVVAFADSFRSIEGEVERTRAVADRVREMLEYQASQFADSPTTPRPPDEVLQTRWGDCKDMSGLLIATLRELGTRAEFVLANSLELQPEPYLPSTRFSHAIVWARTAGGQEFWIDPTAQHLPFPGIPYTLQGAPGLVVTADEYGGWQEIPVLDEPLYRNVVRVEGTLHADGSLEAHLRQSGSGELAAAMRELVRTFAAAASGFASQSIGALLPGAQVESVSMEFSEGLEEAMVVEADVRVEAHATATSGLLLVSPPWINESMGVPLAQASERQLPLELIAERATSDMEVLLQLPDGYEPMGLEPHFRRESDFGTVEIERELLDGGRTLRLKQVTSFVGQRVPPERYPELREFIMECAREHRKQVVLSGG